MLTYTMNYFVRGEICIQTFTEKLYQQLGV